MVRMLLLRLYDGLTIIFIATSMLDTVLRDIPTEHTVSVGGVVNSQSLTTQAAVIANAYAIDSM